MSPRCRFRMANNAPFGRPGRKVQRTNEWSRIRALGKLDGSRGPGRTPVIPLHLSLDEGLAEWFKDRGAILGIPYTTLCRDILATWRELVIAAEQERGIQLDQPSAGAKEIRAPERVPGYREALHPQGLAASHLDSSPLSAEETL